MSTTGALSLPEGRRWSAQEAGFGNAVAQLFEDRLLPFDLDAATAFARMMAKMRAPDLPVSVADGQIPAMGTMRGFAVATRDVDPSWP